MFGFAGHSLYDELRDFGSLIAAFVALLAGSMAYRAGRIQADATSRAADEQVKALKADKDRVAENVRDAVQVEITSMMTNVIEVANLLGYRRKQGKPGILPQTRELIALSLGTPVIYSEIADRVALLDDPYPVVIFYAKVAEARSIIGSPWEDQIGPLPDFVGRTLACLQDALLLARPIIAGEVFGGKRLDLERRQHMTAEIDKCLRDIFGSRE